ncbi:MAG: hypothetical protein CL910_20160 [Deltaproteobacteria bacterium]|nr:hypothetical protein [Deltaproteobacteria bacterium]
MSRFAAPLALLAVVGLSRLWALDADPAGFVHAHVVTDEGWWAHNARNFLLAGHWILDEHNPPLWLAPLHTLLVWASHAALGPSLWATRLPSALASLVVCGLGGVILASELSRRWALLGVGLLAPSSFLFGYGRVAMVESLQLALLMVAFLGAVRGVGRPRWAALSAAALVASALAKPSGVGVGLACFALLVIRARDQRDPRSVIAFAGAGFAAAGLWAALFVIPNLDAVQTALFHRAGSTDVAPLAETLLFLGQTGSPPDSQLLPLLAPWWWALTAAVVLRGLSGHSPLRGVLADGAWLWWFAAVAVTGLELYQPDRRMLLGVPPLVILLLLHMADARRARPPATPGWQVLCLPVLLLGSGLAVASLGAVEPALSSLAADWHVGEEPGLSRSALAGLTWAGALGLAALVLGGARALLPGRSFRLHPAWILAPVLLVETGTVLHALATSTYTLRAANERLALLTGAEPPSCRIVQGKIASTLALGSEAFAFHVRDWEGGIQMNLDGFETLGPRFVVVGRRSDGRVWAPPIAAPLDRLEKLDALPLWPDRRGRPRLHAELYRVPHDLGPCRNLPSGPTRRPAFSGVPAPAP